MESTKMSKNEFLKRFMQEQKEQKTEKFERNMKRDNKNPRTKSQLRFNRLFCQV